MSRSINGLKNSFQSLLTTLHVGGTSRASAHFGVPWRFGHHDVMSCSVRQHIGIAAVIVVTRRSSWLIKNCRASNA